MTTADEPDLTPAPTDPAAPAEPQPALSPGALSPGALIDILRGALPLPTEGPVAALPSGELDITVGGKHGTLVHLPRPLFGQMKTLIRAEGRLADVLRAVEQRNSAYRNKLMVDVAKFEGAAGPGNVELSVENLEGLAAIRDESREHVTQGEEATEAALVEFWTLVFATLDESDPPEPDQWPVDLLDATLPGKVINHWRYAQPGPG